MAGCGNQHCRMWVANQLMRGSEMGLALLCGSGGMADASDLKSDVRMGVRVRTPSPAL